MTIKRQKRKLTQRQKLIKLSSRYLLMASFLLMPSQSRGLLISKNYNATAKLAERKPAVGDMSFI